MTSCALEFGMDALNMFPLKRSNLLTFHDGDTNQREWKELLSKHYEALQIASSEGTVAATERHQRRGQLLGKGSCNSINLRHCGLMRRLYSS